jgi:Leucine-rich repeat (LRR) protein
MKKQLLILLCLPMIGVGQQTYVPDNNFEAYLENNGMGNGIPYDSSVFTSAIDTLTYLDLSFGAGTAIGFFDLTGIEDFTALTYLNCSNNQITSLDVSSNIALIDLYCQGNQITSLDVSGATALTTLYCQDNQLTSLDVSSNTTLNYLHCLYNQLTSLDVSGATALTVLGCTSNQLTSLDVSNNTALTNLWCNGNQLPNLSLSQNTALTELICNSNQLTSLDLRNGNNTNLLWFTTTENTNLSCVDVDNVAWSTANWTIANNNIDAQHYFSNNCTSTEIEEYNSNKGILKITDLLGRETNQTNQPLFYIYDDGSVEKKIILE